MINCLELCRHCWNPIKINLPFLASLSIRFLISHHFHVFPSSNIIQYEFKSDSFSRTWTCAVQTLLILRLWNRWNRWSENFWRNSSWHSSSISASSVRRCRLYMIIPIEAVWRTKILMVKSGEGVASYSTQQLLLFLLWFILHHPCRFCRRLGIIWTQKIDKGVANVAAVVDIHPVGGAWSTGTRISVLNMYSKSAHFHVVHSTHATTFAISNFRSCSTE